MKHCNLKITGKVQGVFFRAEAKKKAKELKLTGFIRNEEDGTVYAELEGEESLINEFHEWVKAGGPELATVENTAFTCDDELKEFEDFTVRT